MPPLKKYLKNKESLIYALHFALDSPANQHGSKRKKYSIFFSILFQINFLLKKKKTKITWDYCEACKGCT